MSYISQVLNKKKAPNFRPVPGQMQRVTPLLTSPSDHLTLEQNPDKKTKKRKKEAASGSGGFSLTSCLCGWAVGFVMLCCCCARTTWNLPLPDTGEEKKRKRTLQEVCCYYRKNRYRIKKVCLKTVHMPAPGDFKYLWFATFLIFKRSGNAVCRIWCEHIPCLTWLWLVNRCSSGKGKAGSHEGFRGSPCCRPDGLFPCTLKAKSEIRPCLLTPALFLPPAIPSQATHMAPSEALLLQAERCKGDTVREYHLRPTATAQKCVIPPLSQMTK